MIPEQHTITSTSGEYTRTLSLVAGPSNQTHPLCIFLDAELYLGSMNALPLLTELMASGAIPQMTCVFVSHVNAEARHADFLCNDRYTKFIAEDVVAWARVRDKNIQAQGNIICGLSLSGLAAAYLALKYPAVFSYALCQSASFWWLKDRQVDWPTTKAKFWLSVGDKETASGLTHAPSGLRQEISQIEGVANAVKLLRSLGGTVKHSMHPGVHSTTPWREELAPAFKWLIGGEE
ncbi:MAG: esterase family protein [Verrucomicrobia bacterium]|jgi:enterochelin esterase family protein|nr:esterase family protein [Verrucomicrobiota bacterium]